MKKLTKLEVAASVTGIAAFVVFAVLIGDGDIQPSSNAEDSFVPAPLAKQTTESQEGQQLPAAAADHHPDPNVGNTGADEIPLVSVLASRSDAPGLGAWIEDILLVDRPYIENLRVIKIDNMPIVQHAEAIQLKVDDRPAMIIHKTESHELPYGGVIWVGTIVGQGQKSLVNIELSPEGAITARLTTTKGVIYIRDSPKLPYHVTYNRKFSD